MRFAVLLCHIAIVWLVIADDNAGDDGGDESEGVIEEYLLAREEVELELEEFYKVASPGQTPDSQSEAMEQLHYSREQLYKSGLSDKELATLLEGDPGLNIGHAAKPPARRAMQKRSIEAKSYRRWTKGIVPYVLTNETNWSNRIEIIRTLRTFERFTCLRYIPWKNELGVTTNQKNTLDHESYLTFVKRSGCWSFQGNIRKRTGGQLISCCSGYTCIHEVGHAMGESHEQQSPNPDRDRMIRINIPGIRPDKTGAYRKHNPEYILSTGYDLSSYMHYAPWSFRQGTKSTFFKFFPEVPHKNSYYYLMREVSVMHDCQDRCSDFGMVCENDGYLTLVDDKCSCRCIPGLDPATGCTTPYKSDPEGLAFPGGKYALPAHKSGCPDDSFVIGSRTQINDGGNAKNDLYDLGGTVSDKQVEQQFCVKDSPDNGFFWPGANFCIYRRGGKCPDGFMEGFVQYDDHPSAASPNAKSGELPDGVFDDDTRFEYCCTNSGFSRDELYLPSRKPFALIKRRDKHCPKVRGMHYEANNLRIDNAEDTGAALTGGDHPMYREEAKTKAFWTSFCEYKPAMIDCGEVIDLDESNPEVTITSPRGAELECYWLIKGPPGERLHMDFSEFDIKGVPGSCLDDLEVRYVRIGQPGLNFCGRRWDKTTISINNTIHMRLSTYGDSTSHFKATIKLLKNADLCYAASDRGMTYAGDVSFTRNFQPCLPWHKMAHCEMHPFKANKFNTLLEGNKCRNPDQATGFEPWCYTHKENCIRNYCDVCLIGKRYDLRDDCVEKKSAGQCDLKDCAKTCADHYPAPPHPVKASEVSCGTPPDVSDASPIDLDQTIFAVGDSVTYTCSYGDSTVESYCLSTGQWSYVGTACSECPPEFEVGTSSKKCYFFPNVVKTYDLAKSYCENKGAVVAFPESEEENAFIRNFTAMNIFVGLTDEAEEGKFMTAAGQAATFTKFKAPEPNNYGRGEDCVEIRKDGFWNDLPCTTYKRRFACQKDLVELKNCLDFLETCTELFSLSPQMCAEFPSFAELQCRFTCGLCNVEDTPKCTVETPGVGAGGTTELARGMTVTSSCEEGFIRLAGDDVRGCTAAGTMTGTPLKCSHTCPTGWATNFDNRYCYKKFQTAKTYGEAEADCKALKGIVTTAKDEKEQKFVDALRGSDSVWIGLTDIKTEGKFIWADGSLPTYTYWNPREPNDYGRHGEDCTHLRDGGKWNDNHCGRKFKFICKTAL